MPRYLFAQHLRLCAWLPRPRRFPLWPRRVASPACARRATPTWRPARAFRAPRPAPGACASQTDASASPSAPASARGCRRSGGAQKPVPTIARACSRLRTRALTCTNARDPPLTAGRARADSSSAWGSRQAAPGPGPPPLGRRGASRSRTVFLASARCYRQGRCSSPA